jgi:hypothetical protein
MALCILSGVLSRANGQPIGGVAVRARGLFSDSGQPKFTPDGGLLTQDPIEVITDDNGGFSMTLLQGIEVQFTIDTINVSRRFTVPAAPSATLQDVFDQ